jgi:WS/DGAT/MGAT family acyltransferase
VAYTHYQRLTALDDSFLALEDENVHMHVGGVSIYEPGELVDDRGGLDMDRVRALSEWALRKSPRFRQKLAYVPLLADPVWIDDTHFNLDYHVRHTSLPAPGDARQLKRLTGRIMSQRLDRGKPLWEMWFVEGLEDRRFAVIAKVHHCMIDGVGATSLLGSFAGTNPDYRPELVTTPWIPRPAPSGTRLLTDELVRRATAPLRAARGIASSLRDPAGSAKSLAGALSGLRDALSSGFTGASETPINLQIGPHRRFDWSRVDISAIKEIRERRGGTLNDVVLATVSAALRRFFEKRGVDPDPLSVRALVPVNIRKEEEDGKLGNRVAFLNVPLPVNESDPVKRLEQVTQTTTELKASHQVEGVEWIEVFADAVAPGMMGAITKLAGRSHPYNVVVTNVPGSPQPAYLLGSKMVATYPLVPLFGDQAVGIALISYAGSLYWGFNSDWESLSDLHDLVEAVQIEFEALGKA